MSDAGYHCFAAYYDRLMSDVDYGKLTDRLFSLFEKHRHTPAVLLDAACGTGNFSMEIARRGVDVIASDVSAEMLGAAAEKSRALAPGILYLQQDIRALDLYGTVDTAVCLMDSLNHLPDLADVQKAFLSVATFLEPGGLFIFDMNTPYKHREILAGRTFVYDLDDLYCVWQNELTAFDSVDITLDFFLRETGGRYRRETESFCERAYAEAEIRGALESCHFSVEGVYGAGALSPPTSDTQRIVWAARRLS